MNAPHLRDVSRDRPSQKRDERIAPHNLDAEAAVISAILVEPSVADRVLDILRHEQFFSEANRRIYEALEQLHASGVAIDTVIVANKLRDSGQFTTVGGAAYLAQLVDATPAVAHVEEHAAIVRDHWRVRTLIATCQKLAAQGYGNVGEVQKFLAEAEAELGQICRVDEARRGTRVAALVSEVYRDLSAAREGSYNFGLSTGYAQLDEVTAGLHPGETTLIAARPSMGKTGFMLSMALKIARTAGQRVLGQAGDDPAQGVGVFSLEQPGKEIVSRLVCTDGGIDSHRMRKRVLTDLEWQHFAFSSDRVAKLPIWVDDSGGLTVSGLRSRIRRMASEAEAASAKLRVVFVDYLQLMNGDGKDENARITENSKALKVLAKDLQLPIVVLSQLNRGTEERANRRPELSDLRGSGSLEQDADNVWFLYRRDYYELRANPDAEPDGEAEVIVAKQRNGPAPATAHLKFFPACTRFDNA